MTKNYELLDLFHTSKNRSIKWKKYFSVYEQLFEKYRNKKITFVEIGVLDGGSLEIWKKYFGKDSRIIGIDNNSNCKKFENENFEIFIGSQSDKNFWKDFFNKVGKVDIILDDGGHSNDQQIITLTECVNNINDDGIHVVEDVHSSYMKYYGNPSKYSFINFAKKIIDDVNYNFPNMKKFNFSLNKMIYSIYFFESIVAFNINRKMCEENISLENNGFKSNNQDTSLNEFFFNFRNNFQFLYKFKLIKKIERLLIRFSFKKKSFSLKKFFK